MVPTIAIHLTRSLLLLALSPTGLQKQAGNMRHSGCVVLMSPVAVFFVTHVVLSPFLREQLKMLRHLLGLSGINT